MMPLKIGFTGTQKGMTYDQKNNFLVTMRELNNDHHIEEFHHGDCIGSDKEAHELIDTFFPNIVIHVHPPEIKDKRAFCKGDVQHKEKPYLERNHYIVQATEILIATPESNNEKKRSGTWSTIRYARKLDRNIMIIVPNGHTK
jgi:hypothetical protein